MDRLQTALSEELDETIDDESRADQLKMSKKSLEIIISICKANTKSSGGYVLAFKDAEAYAALAPSTKLTFVPGWLVQEAFRLELA